MQNINKIQAIAKYNGEEVQILDVVQVAGMKEPEYLINYAGPVWVRAYDLDSITWLAD